MSPRVRALPNANEQHLGCMLRIASWKQCPSFGLSQCAVGLSQCAGTGHLEGSDQRLLSPVSSPNWSCCVSQEWPVFPPRGSAVDLALAAFSVLRARAARKPNSQNRLTAAVRCVLFKGQLRATLAIIQNSVPARWRYGISRLAGQLARRQAGPRPASLCDTPSRPSLDRPLRGRGQKIRLVQRPTPFV